MEKGIGFELKIAELFRQKGYYVTHNIIMKGKSGAEHQIDVLAEYKAPLHTSCVIIEAKAYSSNVDKDIIMKLIQIQQDLSADRAILATTSDFTPGALQTAKQYSNVELWDRKKIISHLGEIQLLDTSDGIRPITAQSVKAISPKLSLLQIKEYAEESARKRSKGGFLGKGKIEERVLGAEKILYPYYDVDIEAKIRVVEKTGWFSKEEVVHTVKSRTGVDGNTGDIIHVTDGGISYEYSYLNNLSREEIQMLYYVSGVKAFEKRNLSSIGWSSGKITTIVNSLTGKGLLVQINARPATYKIARPYPTDPAAFVSLMEKYSIQEIPTDGKKIKNHFSAGSIPTAFNNFWASCEVKSIDLVYYPYYTIVYERKDGVKRIEVIDGMSGLRQENLDNVISVSIDR